VTVTFGGIEKSQSPTEQGSSDPQSNGAWSPVFFVEKSQSLLADQGSSDWYMDQNAQRHTFGSQSLTNDRGVPDCLIGPSDRFVGHHRVSTLLTDKGESGRRFEPMNRQIPNLGKSQSLPTDQGISDDEERDDRLRQGAVQVAIPPYRFRPPGKGRLRPRGLAVAIPPYRSGRFDDVIVPDIFDPYVVSQSLRTDQGFLRPSEMYGDVAMLYYPGKSRSLPKDQGVSDGVYCEGSWVVDSTRVSQSLCTDQGSSDSSPSHFQRAPCPSRNPSLPIRAPPTRTLVETPRLTLFSLRSGRNPSLLIRAFPTFPTSTTAGDKTPTRYPNEPLR
jgi:hypothetical protein